MLSNNSIRYHIIPYHTMSHHSLSYHAISHRIVPHPTLLYCTWYRIVTSRTRPLCTFAYYTIPYLSVPYFSTYSFVFCRCSPLKAHLSTPSPLTPHSRPFPTRSLVLECFRITVGVRRVVRLLASLIVDPSLYIYATTDAPPLEA